MQWNVFDLGRPTRALLDRIGDKWSVLVVCALHDGPLRFGELKRAIGGPAPKVLTAVLRSLEGDDLLTRHVYSASPLRVEYDLTPLGRSLLAAVDRLRQWAEQNMAKVTKAQARQAATQESTPDERLANKLRIVAARGTKVRKSRNLSRRGKIRG